MGHRHIACSCHLSMYFGYIAQGENTINSRAVNNYLLGIHKEEGSRLYISFIIMTRMKHIIIAVILLFSTISTGFTLTSLVQVQRYRFDTVLSFNVLEEETTCSDYHQPIHNIIRDLDGKPLTNEYFAEHMGLPNVESYCCNEDEAFRGFMSNACRVKLFPGGESAFYKCIVFKDLGHAWEKMKTAPFKLVRDIKSYEVVASFLKSKACQQMVDKTGIKIPKCYDVRLEPNTLNPIESKFSFLLEDLSPSDGWYQKWLVDSKKECEVCLTAYAKLHAFFWHGSNFWKDKDAAKELKSAVWQCGSYVQLHAQPSDQCYTLKTEWAKKRMKFKDALSSYGYWDNLGERLQAIAPECAQNAHPFAEDESIVKEYERYRTFVHGDPKQANIFFRHSDLDESEINVALIDYQWSGFGLGASDIAHFLTSAVYADLLEGYGEEYLMAYYHDELLKYLVKYGAFMSLEDAKSGYSWEVFTNQYETAVLDLCRLVIAYTWERFEEPIEKLDKVACARTMNKTSYNKSVPNVVWLMSRCDSILKSRGV